MSPDLLDAPAITIVPGAPLHCRIDPPASKSATNRALVAAALADGVSRLRSPLDSDDARAMRRAVEALGAEVSDDGDDWVVTGTAGRPRAPRRPLDADLSGTTARFVAAVAALVDTDVTVTGREPLRRRPIGPLAAALRAMGARAVDTDGGLPLTVGGGLVGGAVTVDATASSQFASAVLLAAPYAAIDTTVSVAGAAAHAYVAMTVDLMRRWGVVVEDLGGHRWRVEAGVGYRARDETVEYDASAAAHLFGMAMATGGSMTVPNATRRTLQPDAGFPLVLASMGGRVGGQGEALTVTGPDRPSPLVADLGAVPDQVTTAAALAALADGTSVLTGVAVVRGHETDRLRALATELRKLGVAIDERDDGLVIRGGAAKGPARLATYDDHRLAMAFAAIAARVPGVVVEDPACVTKTYPAFWRDLAGAGFRVEAVA